MTTAHACNNRRKQHFKRTQVFIYTLNYTYKHNANKSWWWLWPPQL